MAGKVFDPDEHEYPVDLPAELTAEEKVRFEELDKVIRDGLGTFVQTGRAMIEMKASSLCREKYGTFEEYLKVEHEISRVHGWRLMEAARTVEMLPMGNTPISERQCRELFIVPDEQRPDVWQGVLDRAESDDVQVTSTLISSYVKAIVFAVWLV